MTGFDETAAAEEVPGGNGGDSDSDSDSDKAQPQVQPDTPGDDPRTGQDDEGDRRPRDGA